VKSISSHLCLHGGAHLRFLSHQLDISFRCVAMDSGSLHRVVCPRTPPLLLVFTARAYPRKESWTGWMIASRDGLPACSRTWVVVSAKATKLATAHGQKTSSSSMILKANANARGLELCLKNGLVNSN